MRGFNILSFVFSGSLIYQNEEKSTPRFSGLLHSFCIIQIILPAFLICSSMNYTAHCGEQDLHEKLSAFPFYLAFTGEDNGYLEPCGCTEKQLGGLTKRHSLINALKSKNDHFMALSLGDLSGKVGRQDEIKMEITLMALDLMGYAVHNIGEKDISMGLELLSYFSRIHNIALLSSNVIAKSKNNLNINPYIMKEIETTKKVYKVCILGTLSPNLVDEGAAEVEVLDPVITLKPLLKELNGEADLLVLLSHAEIEESIILAETLPELDLVISGHSIDDPNGYITKVRDTYVVPVGEKGKYLGIFGFQPERKDLGIKRLNEIAHGKKDYYSLTQYHPEENQENENALEMIPLDDTYENSLEIERLLEIYQQRLRDEELVKNIYREPHPSGLTFTGNDVCSLCHNKIFKHWQETGHAHAYETLLKSGHQDDPECLFCHTVGMHYISGFETIESTPRMKDVGCESCHGPGNEHKESPAEDYGKVSPENCTICHENEHSPNFRFEEYWHKIKHPPKDN